MSEQTTGATSPTLLGRLRNNPPDPGAWGAFVRRYGGKIFAWCRRWQVQEADAEDVTQALLLEIPRKMRSFVYDPSKGSFRGWLKTVVRRAVGDYARHQGRAVRGSGDSGVRGQLESAEAAADLEERLREEFDLEMLEEALARVQLRVNAKTWDAFRMTAIEDRPGKEVAESLGLKVAAVYVYRNRVQKMVQDELRLLEGAPPEPSGEAP